MSVRGQGGSGAGRSVSAVPAGSVSASLLSVHARSFDPLDSQEDGIVTAKLRVREDSDCGPCGAAPLCRQRFVRRAFRARSRSGRFRCPLRPSSPHHVKWSCRLIACQQDHSDSRLNNVDDLATDPPSACILCSCPDICPSSRGHQAEEPRRSQGHRCKEYRHLLTGCHNVVFFSVFFLVPFCDEKTIKNHQKNHQKPSKNQTENILFL